MFVFIPDTSILCFTEWSANLTEHFISDWNELMKLYVSLIYIGDESGALRLYPGQCYLKKINFFI